MWSWFRRPTIASCKREQLYSLERMLIDAQAKRDHATVVAAHHEVNVQMLQKQIFRLTQELQ
jgi:hypothetical protein